MRVQELGHVVLIVRDLERSVHFYRDILGFPEVGRLASGPHAFSAGRTHHELLLFPGGDKLPEGGNRVLRHIALKIGTDDDQLREAKRELDAAAVAIERITKSVHTHSIYVRDPDGNQVELYIDPQPEVWRADPLAALDGGQVPLEL